MASVLIAYGVIILPEQRKLNELNIQATRLYGIANRNDEIVSEEPRVQLARRRIRTDLLKIGSAPLSASTGSLLESLERVSTKLSVRVLSVNPASTASNENATPNSLAVGDVGVEVEGRFPSVLAMLADFSTGERLVGIDTVELRAAENGENGEPVLDVTIGARIYALNADWEGRLGVASPGIAR